MSVILDNWAITSGGGPYTAPEATYPILVGEATGEHPSLGDLDKKPIRTSRLVHLGDIIAETKSGSTYVLGSISQEFQDYLNKNGYTVQDYKDKLST